jgi:hypothetical protein
MVIELANVRLKERGWLRLLGVGLVLFSKSLGLPYVCERENKYTQWREIEEKN